MTLQINKSIFDRELSYLKLTVASYKKRIAIPPTLIKAIDDTLYEYENHLEPDINNIDIFDSELEEMQSELEYTEENLTSAEYENMSLEEEISNLQSELEYTEENLTSAEYENMSLEEEISNLQSKNEELQCEIVDLTSEIKTLS